MPTVPVSHQRSWRLSSKSTLSLGTVFSISSDWFPPQLTAALAAIAEAAHQCQEPHYERIALISLSAAIISKWPNTLSYAMDIDHTRPHRRVQRFTLEHVLKTYLSRLDRSLACLGALYNVYHA